MYSIGGLGPASFTVSDTCKAIELMPLALSRPGDRAGASVRYAAAGTPPVGHRMDETAGRRPAVAPQIVSRRDGGFNLIRRAPPIENLVLTGGGAKGVGVGGALLALGEAGQLADLQTVAGSSVGALMAGWLGVGAGIDKLNTVLTGDLRPLLATDETLSAVYPDIGFHNTAKVIATLLSPLGASHGTAAGMIRKLDEVTAGEVRTFLDGFDRATLRRAVTAFVSQRRGSDGETDGKTDGADRREVERTLARLAVLAEKPDFTKSRAGKMVTFGDMAVLHALAPRKFRLVSMTAHDTDSGRNVILDMASAPGLPLAYGARASMAHPLIATGVSFPGLPGRAAAHVFADGGISSNVPVEAAVPSARGRAGSDPTGLRTPEQQRRRASLAVMAFDNDGETGNVMHAPPARRGFFGRLFDAFVSFVSGWVASNPRMRENTAADQAKLRDFGPNVITVKHGDLSTMDIDASVDRKRKALAEALESAREQLSFIRGDLYAVEVGSVAEAFALLDAEEKALLRAHGGALAAAAGADPSAQAQATLLAMAVAETGVAGGKAARREMRSVQSAEAVYLPIRA